MSDSLQKLPKISTFLLFLHNANGFPVAHVCGTYNNILRFKSTALASLFNLSDKLTFKALMTRLSELSAPPRPRMLLGGLVLRVRGDLTPFNLTTPDRWRRFTCLGYDGGHRAVGSKPLRRRPLISAQRSAPPDSKHSLMFIAQLFSTK